MIEIYSLELTEKLEKDLFEYLLQFVDKDKKARIKRFIKWEDAHRTLFADLLIRYIIIEKKGLKNENILFSTNEYGKPFLDNGDGFHFNVSHSGNWVVCAIDNLPIGIDVEQINSIDFDISKKYFSKEEHNDLMSKSDSDKLYYFFTLWTLKESYIKALGKGLSLPLNSFTMKFLNNNEIEIKCNGNINNNRFFTQYVIDKGYKMAVCALNEQFPEFIVTKKTEELIENFLNINTQWHKEKNHETFCHQ